MEQRIRALAYLSVVRGCGFGLLTIFTAMVGVAADLSLVLRTGGIGLLLMAFILVLKAARAYRVSFRATEIWILLDKEQRPPAAIAGALIPRFRREALLLYGYRSAWLAAALLTAEIVRALFAL